MAMTAAVKDELSRITVSRPSARRAEIATMLRFAGAPGGRRRILRTRPGVAAIED